MAYRRPPGSQSRLPFTPQCTHLTMTRLYGLDYVCEACHRPGPFGWVYRCTQDRDDLIEHAAQRGYTDALDYIGNLMTEELASITRKGSPAARSDKFSFFQEVTPEQMAQYRPDQIAMILRQREELHHALHREQLRKSSAILLQHHHLRGTAVATDSLHDSVYRNPWVCRDEDECMYKICPFCRPSAADRAYLSLNAVADGEIPPTAATGFGFHLLGERPVVDANVVRELGLRSAPPPRSLQSYTDSSLSTDLDMMEMLGEQIARSRGRFQGRYDEVEYDHEAVLALLPSIPSSPGQLKHSPAYENLAAIDEPSTFISQGGAVRPPWTPPPSPSRYGKESSSERHVLGLAAEPSITDGRSSNSLKTNPAVRNQVLTSVPSASALAHIQQSGHSTVQDPYVPYLPESAYDVGLTLPFDEEAYELARTTPLPASDPMEHLYLQEAMTPMMEYESVEGRFEPAPLQLENGVAVLEESVELRVPDVITQG
ncbi:Fc.00g005050.m01.CDS01 [Cosmosporella sp. VM-42]